MDQSYFSLKIQATFSSQERTINIYLPSLKQVLNPFFQKQNRRHTQGTDTCFLCHVSLQVFAVSSTSSQSCSCHCLRGFQPSFCPVCTLTARLEDSLVWWEGSVEMFSPLQTRMEVLSVPKRTTPQSGIEHSCQNGLLTYFRHLFLLHVLSNNFNAKYTVVQTRIRNIFLPKLQPKS